MIFFLSGRDSVFVCVCVKRESKCKREQEREREKNNDKAGKIPACFHLENMTEKNDLRRKVNAR